MNGVALTPPPVMTDLNVIVSGQGGDGSLTVVTTLAEVLRQNGMRVYTERDVLSRIKGGITAATLRASRNERFTIGSTYKIIVVFDDAGDIAAHVRIIIDDQHQGSLAGQLLGNQLILNGDI